MSTEHRGVAPTGETNPPEMDKFLKHLRVVQGDLPKNGFLSLADQLRKFYVATAKNRVMAVPNSVSTAYTDYIAKPINFMIRDQGSSHAVPFIPTLIGLLGYEMEQITDKASEQYTQLEARLKNLEAFGKAQTSPTASVTTITPPSFVRPIGQAS